MTESKRKQYIRVLRIAANHADDGMITVSVDEAREIIDLLTEQEPAKPIGGYGCYICGVCKNPLTSVSQKFCSECGRAVKWDD